MGKGYRIYNGINCYICRKKHSCMHRFSNPFKFSVILSEGTPFYCRTAYEIPNGKMLVNLFCSESRYREV